MPSAARRSLGPSSGQPITEEARTRGFPAPAFAGCGFVGAQQNVGCGSAKIKTDHVIHVIMARETERPR